MDFSKLKSMSGKKSLENLTAEVNKLSNQDSGKKASDSRFWAPTVDKAGNGYSVIRFLPPTGDEDVPFVRTYDHAFQGPTGLWYIENSLTTIGQTDPLSVLNGKLWNTGNEADKETARKQKRRLHFISNIYVIQDQAKPENNGKVFLFKYGKKIFEKLNEAMNPQFEDEMPVNPFDLWEGANFKLKIRNLDGYRNYDKSEFETPKPLFDSDDEMEKVWKQQYSLKEFLDPSNFKTYDALKERLDRVLNVQETKSSPTRDPIPSQSAPTFNRKDAEVEMDVEDDDEESLDFFKKLAS